MSIQGEPSPEISRFLSFTSDFIIIAGSTILAQIVTILAAPFITRLFEPNAFGISSIFASIIAIIVVIACLRYEQSIVLSNSDIEAANLFVICIVFTLIVSFISIPFVLFFGNEIASLLNSPQLVFYLWLVPIFVFIGGVTLPIFYWNSRKKDFKHASIARIAGSVSITGTQLGSGIAGYGTAGALIFASLFGQFISTLFIGITIFKHDFQFFRNNIRIKMISQVVKRYVHFPLIDTSSALLNTISWSLPIFLLAAFFSPVITGFYSLAYTVIQLPSSLVGNAICQVFFPHGTDANREKKLFILFEDLFKVLIVVISFPLLTLMIIGRDFFSVVFGSNWAEAGVFAQLLSIFFLINFIFSPFSLIYIIQEKQVFGLVFNIFNFLTRLLTLVIGGLFFNVYVTLTLFSLAGIFVYIIVIAQLMKYANVRWKIIKQHIISVLLPFLPAGLLLLFLQIFVKNPYVTVFIGSLLIIIYYLYILKIDPQLRDILFSLKFW